MCKMEHWRMLVPPKNHVKSLRLPAAIPYIYFCESTTQACASNPQIHTDILDFLNLKYIALPISSDSLLNKRRIPWILRIENVINLL